MEEWSDGYWRPSFAPIQSVRSSKPAPQELLSQLGIPANDWYPDPTAPWVPPHLVRLLGHAVILALPATSLLNGAPAMVAT